MSIRSAATVPSESLIPKTFISAIGITMSENAEITTAIDGTNVRNRMKMTRLIPTNATAMPINANWTESAPKLAAVSLSEICSYPAELIALWICSVSVDWVVTMYRSLPRTGWTESTWKPRLLSIADGESAATICTSVPPVNAMPSDTGTPCMTYQPARINNDTPSTASGIAAS